MFDAESENIRGYKQNKVLVAILWSSIKLTIAFFLVTYFEYGIFVVFGYILYSLESHSGLQFLNTQESNYHFTKLYNHNDIELAELKKEISTLKDLLEEYESRLDAVEDVEDDEY